VNKPPTHEELTTIRNDLDEWPGADDAVKQLVSAGCDADMLCTLLVRLRRASATDVWTKAELNDAARGCNRVPLPRFTVSRFRAKRLPSGLHGFLDSQPTKVKTAFM
jgi:hypothetical protein